MRIYINRSMLHECRNWERGCAVSFLGNLFLDFRYSVWIPGILECWSSDLLPPVVHDDLPAVLVVVVLVERPSLHLDNNHKIIKRKKSK